MDTFIDNLPGFPDNIRRSSSGGYWVAMSAVRPNPGFSMLDFLSQRPWIKKLIFKVPAFGDLVNCVFSFSELFLSCQKLFPALQSRHAVEVCAALQSGGGAAGWRDVRAELPRPTRHGGGLHQRGPRTQRSDAN